MTMTIDAVFRIVFACVSVLCVCIRNGYLKQTCDRDCDFLQVYRDEVGMGTVSVGWGSR